MAVTMTSCTTANIGCKKHAADLAFIGSTFSQPFFLGSITSK